MAQGAVEIWTQVFNNSVRPYEIILNIKDMFFKSYEFAFVSLVNIPFMLSVWPFSHPVILSQERTSTISVLH